jgi:hypothetical protein
VPEVVGDEVVDQAAEDLGKKKKPASKKGGANKKGKSNDIGEDNVETKNDGDEDTAASDDVVVKKSKTVAKVPFIYYVSTYCTKLNLTKVVFFHQCSDQ